MEKSPKRSARSSLCSFWVPQIVKRSEMQSFRRLPTMSKNLWLHLEGPLEMLFCQRVVDDWKTEADSPFKTVVYGGYRRREGENFPLGGTYDMCITRQKLNNHHPLWGFRAISEVFVALRVIGKSHTVMLSAFTEILCEIDKGISLCK